MTKKYLPYNTIQVKHIHTDIPGPIALAPTEQMCSLESKVACDHDEQMDGKP